MDDYIFLIIAIALSIFGAINQNKKKKNAEHLEIPEKQSSRNFFMDQLLGDDFLEKPETEVKPLVRQMPFVRKDPVAPESLFSPSVVHGQGFKSTLPSRPKRSFQPAMAPVKTEEQQIEPADEETPDYLEDFSLRKAFVYSEIMARKY